MPHSFFIIARENYGTLFTKKPLSYWYTNSLIINPRWSPDFLRFIVVTSIPVRRRLFSAYQWRHYGHDSVSNHQPHDCLLNHLFRRRSKKTSKLRVTGLCAGTSTGTGEFPAQMGSNAENVSIWWRHHEIEALDLLPYFLQGNFL